MGARDTLVTEVGAGVAILGLLLVFLPIFVSAVSAASDSATASVRTIRLREVLTWSVPATIGVAAASVTTGLMTLWGTASLGKPTAILLTVTVWAVVAQSVTAVLSAG